MGNPSTVPHAVSIEGNGVDEKGTGGTAGVGQGQKSTVSANLKAGTYTFYCPVDGHKQAGMEGTLTVTVQLNRRPDMLILKRRLRGGTTAATGCVVNAEAPATPARLEAAEPNNPWRFARWPLWQHRARASCRGTDARKRQRHCVAQNRANRDQKCGCASNTDLHTPRVRRPPADTIGAPRRHRLTARTQGFQP